MLIRCPNCDTAYALPGSAIGPAGRQVRCSRCGNSWRAYPVPEFAIAEAVEDPNADIVFVDRSETQIMPDQDDLDLPDDAEVLPPGAEFAPPPEPPPATPPPQLEAERTDGFRRQRTQPAVRRKPAAKVRPSRLAQAVAGARAGAAAGRMPSAAGLAWLGGAGALLLLAVVFRGPVVSVAPDLAGLYAAAGMPVNLRGLEFRNIRAERGEEDGRPILSVEGDIANIQGGEVDVPTVRLAIRAPDGQEVYAWSVVPQRDRLAAGQSVPFRTRLASPPADTSDLVVRFVERTRPAKEAL